MEIENTALRLKQFISSLNINDSEFADSCNISRSTLSLFLSGKNKKINEVTISQIHDSYPALSINWLLFGEGDMLTTSHSNNHNHESHEIPHEIAKSPDNDPNDFEFDKEKAYNFDPNLIKQIVREAVASEIEEKIQSFLLEQKNLNRKSIKQVTVYFDDNTFISFPNRD